MIIKTKIFLLLFLSLFILTYSTLLAQILNKNFSKEIGWLNINYYGPKDYNSEPQNLAILQDSRGIIYAGNNSGTILEYDGVSWRHITISNKLPIESLAEDTQGQIYVGGTKDFGLLKLDSIGSLHYQSFLKYVNQKDLNFTWVTPIHATTRGVYFQTQQSLFLWQNNKLKTWKAHTSFTNSFWIYNDLYIHEKQIGLMKLENDSLKIVPGGEKFSEDVVLVMMPYEKELKSGALSRTTNNKQILIGFANEGLFIFNGKSLQPLKGEANDFVRRYGIRCSADLSNGKYAIGTLQNGIVIFNSHGNIIQVVDRNSGLESNIAYSIIPGRQGGLWIALQQGIANLINTDPVFSFYNRQNGLDGVVLALPAPIRYKGILYTSTTTGIYYLDSAQKKFKMVQGLEGDFWSLFKYGNSLFAVRESLRKVNGTSSSLVKMMDEKVGYAQRSYIDSNRIYLGLKEGGFQILQKENKNWIESPKIKGIYEFARNIVEEPNGDLWFGDEGDGLVYIRFSNSKENPEIQKFSTKDGLPPGRMYAYRTSLHPVFSSSHGIYKFDSNAKRFIPDSIFGKQISDGSLSTGFLSEDKKGNIWISVYDGTDYYLAVSRLNRNGTYTLDLKSFLGIPSTGIWTIYPEDNGIIWFGGEEGLVRYNDNLPKYIPSNFQAQIRSVFINVDSLIYAGNKPDNIKLNAKELTSAVNELRFEYSISSYYNSDKNQYKIYLEGFDKIWLPWTTEVVKEYTHLPAGNYVFHVRAKNIYGHESREDTFAFTLLPPFYLTWWAYSIYGFIFISFLILTINRYKNWHTSKLRQRNIELETTVANRTAELAEKNAELSELSKIKSRFFANISHEFRTPLTLIVGQIENLLPDLKKEYNIKRAKMALRNSKQLQQLINQLLDLSKFDAQEMKLKACEQNVVPLLKYLTGSFESFAEKKNIILKFESSIENIPVFFEQDKIEKIMHNLLSNAIKFTPSGGNVLVRVSAQLKGHEINVQENIQSMLGGDLKIVVQDSGKGIPKNLLPHIFDRFFQVDNSTTREYEGTGIGLALTKELVQIHGGGISVESKEGFGTTFIILIPLGKKHLDPNQIIETNAKPLDLIEPDKENISELSINEESKKEESEIASNQNKKLILIVEDNPDMRTYINETLINNYNVIEASNGEEGLKIAVEEIPDLIITDVMMPQMDGYELTRKLKTNQVTNHIPLIMLTAKSAEKDKLEGLETGVDAFIIKPFSTKELGIRVRKLIEIREQLTKQIGSKAVLTPSEVSVSSMDQKFLKRMHDIIEENLGKETFGVEELAGQVGVSKRQLQRKLKALIDCTPTQCIRIMRLKRAKQLLEQNAGNVTEVAFSVGYGDVTAFSRAFKEEFDILPSAIISQKKS